MVAKDEWVQAAITDDNVVVELLVRLKQAQAAPSPPKSALPAPRWGIRQRRSRPMLLRCDGKRDGDFNVSARGSPTTPLCWSGGSSDASPSAAEGFEETSTHVLRSPPVAPSRSKGSACSETNRTSSKKPGRKKTFAEEDLVLKERVHLEKEIASTRATRKEHHDDLKRIRLDLNLVDTAKNSSLIDNEPGKAPCPRAPPSESLDDDRELPLDSHNVGKSIFVLPDLNMMPAEDDSGHIIS
ncbi:hypothetical protein like AT4G32030 [Hibiscus trionum]|uniref:Uncharacterized protein n=1 Tax=Hibiscus trionum TaxID=183268 RepID=A0A9W7M6G2_HIBTR|nr:hypothetical protein like AT4G32030 [Hibiscus trionum]